MDTLLPGWDVRTTPIMKSIRLSPASRGAAIAVMLLGAPCIEAADTATDATTQLRAIAATSDPRTDTTTPDLVTLLRQLLAALDVKVDEAELIALLARVKAELETAVPKAVAGEDPSEAVAEQPAAATGVQTSALTTTKLKSSGGLQSGGRGLSSAEDWRRVFPRKSP